MKRLAPFLVALTLASAAVAKTPDRIAVTVTGPLAAREVEDAVRKELSESRIDGAATARVVISVTDDLAKVSYTDPEGRVVERSIRLPGDPARAREAIAHLVGNLVRDQTADLEASLRPKKAEAPPAGTSSAPPAASGAPPATSSAPPAAPPPPPGVTVVPPPTAARREASSPAEGSASKVAACKNGRFTWVAGEVWPDVAVPPSSRGEDVARGATLAFVAGHRGYVRGAEVSVIGGYGPRSVCGVQWAGVFAMTKGPMLGFQAAGVYVSAGEVRGVQTAPVAFAGDVHGVQTGVVAWARGEVVGVQAGVVTHADRTRGVTAGVVNLGGDHEGATVGVVNVAQKARFQLGVVNVAEESDVPLGIVNVIRKGRLTADAFALDYPGAAAGITHGGKYAHTVYAVGARRTRAGETRPVFILGIGGHVPLGKAFFDADVLTHFLPGPSFENNANAFQLRLLFGGEVAPGLGFFGGPTGTVSQAITAADERFGGLGGDRKLGESGGHVWRAWPGATLGVRWGKL